MKSEVNEAYANYMEICQALSQIPTMVGYARFIMDSYDAGK